MTRTSVITNLRTTRYNLIVDEKSYPITDVRFLGFSDRSEFTKTIVIQPRFRDYARWQPPDTGRLRVWDGRSPAYEPVQVAVVQTHGRADYRRPCLPLHGHLPTRIIHQGIQALEQEMIESGGLTQVE